MMDRLRWATVFFPLLLTACGSHVQATFHNDTGGELLLRLNQQVHVIAAYGFWRGRYDEAGEEGGYGERGEERTFQIVTLDRVWTYHKVYGPVWEGKPTDLELSVRPDGAICYQGPVIIEWTPVAGFPLRPLAESGRASASEGEWAPLPGGGGRYETR